MGDSSSEDSQDTKRHGKSLLDVQRQNIMKLMNDPNKDIYIPDSKDEGKLPRAFFPHEFVRNVMGASAGAGSGEFDIYRGCRNREMIRQEYLQQKAEKEKSRIEFEAKRLANLAEAEKKTAKKRAKRLKSKMKNKTKNKSKNNKNEESDSTDNDGEEEIEIDLDEKIPEDEINEKKTKNETNDSKVLPKDIVT